MAERTDLLTSTRDLLKLLINGDDPFIGFQIQLSEDFGPSKPNHTPILVRERYAYDPETQGLPVISTPLPEVLVTIQVLNRVRVPLYKRDQHPTLPGSAWARRYQLQWDVWAPTPVLCDNACDKLEEAVTKSAPQLWSLHGIRLNIDDFQDAPYEADSGIYRALARGYCTVAVFTET